jgi:flagellar protein FliO/FliZ
MAAAPSRPLIIVPVIVAWVSQSPPAAYAASPQLGELDSYFKMIWGLLVVLGVIFLLYALLKKRFSLLATSPEKNIKILEIKPLMGRKALCLVSVKGHQYLIGLSGDRITHLATLPDETDMTFAETLRATVKDRQP